MKKLFILALFVAVMGLSCDTNKGKAAKNAPEEKADSVGQDKVKVDNEDTAH